LVFRYKEFPSSLDEKRLIDFAKSQNLVLSLQINSSLFPIFLPRKNQIYCGDFKLIVDSDIFIQATKRGLEIIVNFLQKTLEKNLANKIAELYCGCGIYSFNLLNSNRQFDCFEGSESMIEILKNNLKNFNINQKILPFVRDLFVDPLSVKELNIYDNIIINPPRNGAGPQIVNIAKSQVKHVQYVSCNPDSLVRDAKILVDENYNIVNIIALDQFYFTKHYEVLMFFEKT
jgi:23S rRNA (uracil1939-C5)-methyltransferase